MMNSKRAMIFAGWAAAFSLFSISSQADQLPGPGFDLDEFHRHAQAGAFRHTIVQRPTCVKGKVVQGEFIMKTPEQDELPLSVTTAVGPFGARSFVTTGPKDFSSTVLSDVGNIFNEEAKKLVREIIADCKMPET